MVFSSKALLAGLLAAAGGVILFTGIQRYIGNFLEGWAWLVIVAGLIISVGARKVEEKIGLNRDLGITGGGVLMFLGIKTYIGGFVEEYGFIFIIIGILLILFRQELANKIMVK